MYIFFAILIVLACILLMCAVLIQKSKGSGLASNYSEGNQFMGYRKTTDFIEKATWSLAIAICLLVSRVVGVGRIEQEVLLGESTFRRKKVFNTMIRFLCPFFAAIILLSSVANALGWISM